MNATKHDEVEQVMVPGNNNIRVRFQGTLQDHVVVRIRGNGWDARGGIDYVAGSVQFLKKLKGLLRGKPELRTPKHLPGFIQYGKAQRTVNRPADDKLQHISWRTAKEYCGDKHVRVQNDALSLHRFRAFCWRYA